jgi:hypothetical protein
MAMNAIAYDVGKGALDERDAICKKNYELSFLCQAIILRVQI